MVLIYLNKTKERAFPHRQRRPLNQVI